MSKQRYIYWTLFCGLLLPTAALCQGARFPDFSAIDKYSSEHINELIDNLYLQPEWFEIKGQGEFCYYALQDSLGKSFYRVDPRNGRKELLFETTRLAQLLKELSSTTHDPRNLKIYQLRFDSVDPEVFTFNIGKEYFCYNRKRDVLSLSEGPKPTLHKRSEVPLWKNFCSDSTYYIYANSHDLYLKGRNSTDSVRLTQEGVEEFSYSTARRAGVTNNCSATGRWLKNSHYFYSIRTDRRAVQEMVLVNNLASPIPTVKTYKFPTPGAKEVFGYDMVVVDADKKRATKVNLAKFPDQKIEIPLFANGYNDGRHIYLLRKSRPADTLELCCIDAKTGKLATLISENTAPHYNEQLFKYHILPGREIVWWSERTGKGAYYLYDKNGSLKNSITPVGKMIAGNIVHMDTLARNVIVEGYGGEKGVNPNYRFYYRVNLDGSGCTLLTPGNGDHSINISPKGNFLVDTYSRMDTIEVRVVRDMTGRELVKLESPDFSKVFASGWQMPKVQKIKAADGITDLYGLIYLPFDLDPAKKYPIITYVYPGPQDDQIPQKFTVDDCGNQTLAQLGCIVINFAYRGSGPKRGREFYTYGYGNLRDYALADDRAAIRQVAALYPCADTTRVGICGHSGGGFMSATAMFTSPEFYKVGVAASGNHDNNIYTQWWGESFHGVKRIQTGDGYTFACKVPTSIELAAHLQGKLLLIHGDQDINVHPANTIRLADALIEADKRFDMIILPGKDHGLGDVYYQNLIRTYFLENLLQPAKAQN